MSKRLIMGLFALMMLSSSGWSASEARIAQAGLSREAVIIVSLTANEDYQGQCEKWAGELAGDLVSRFGFSPSEIVLAGADTISEIPSGIARIAATKVEIETILKGYAKRPGSETDFYLFVFGSGSFDGREYKLNLKGPDLSGAEVKVLLDAIPRHRQIMFWGTSCSGELLKLLGSKNRLVLAATRSGGERNDPRFPGFFLEGFRSPDSDTDKDSRVSWLEAYQSAKNKTEESYKSEGHIATEHPVFDDDGDGEWHPIVGDNKGDGSIAAGVYFESAKAGIAQVKQNPALAALRRDRDQLEAQIRELRIQKSEMKSEDYERKLEELLLKLARISSEIRKLESAPVKP
jgi:hypothetical protein